MQFLYPIGFLALAGLLIPLIIHLWNVKESKKLKIGSIRLLGRSARQSSKSIRINEWPLLLLRLLLIVLIGCFLAQPYLQEKYNSKHTAGWILVKRGQFQEVYQNHKKQIDDLVRSGFEIRDFDLGFAPVSLQDTLNSLSTRIDSSRISSSDLLEELNAQLRKGQVVYLFADLKLSQFGSWLPKLNYTLNWEKISSADTVESWTSDLAGKKYVANSTTYFTSYKPEKYSEATPILINIYSDNQTHDVLYLKTSLKTIADYSGRQIKIKYWDGQPLADSIDAGFWLSERKPDQAFISRLKKSANLFYYQSGKIREDHSYLLFNQDIKSEGIELFRRIVAADLNTSKIWTDAYGNPILTLKSIQERNVYAFYSRFDPQWSDLVWRPEFVAALMPLIVPDHKNKHYGFEVNPSDQRQVSSAKKMFLAGQGIFQSTAPDTFISIQNGFWIAIFMVFLMERLLSFYYKKWRKHA